MTTNLLPFHRLHKPLPSRFRIHSRILIILRILLKNMRESAESRSCIRLLPRAALVLCEGFSPTPRAPPPPPLPSAWPRLFSANSQPTPTSPTSAPNNTARRKISSTVSTRRRRLPRCRICGRRLYG